MKKLLLLLLCILLLGEKGLAQRNDSTYYSIIHICNDTKLQEHERLRAFLLLDAEMLKADSTKARELILDGIALARTMKEDSATMALQMIQAEHLQTHNEDSAIVIYNTIAEQAAGQQLHKLAAEAAFNAATILDKQAKYREAITQYTLAARHFEKSQDTLRQITAMRWIGFAHLNLNRMGESEESFRTALALSRQASSQQWTAELLRNLGYILQVQDRYQEGLLHYKEGLQIAVSRGDLKSIMKLNNNMGLHYLNTGEYQAAIPHFKTCIRLSNELGENFTYAYHNLGLLYKRQHDQDSALYYYGESLKRLEAIQNAYGMAFTLKDMASCFEELRQPDSVERYFNKAVAICKANNYMGPLHSFYEGQSQWYADLGKVSLALTYLDSAKTIAIETQDTLSLGKTTYKIANTYLSMGEYEEAQKHYHEARQWFTLTRQSSWLADISYAMAMLSFEKQQYDSAIFYTNHAISRHVASGDSCSLSRSYYFLGKIYRNTTMPDSTGYYLSKAEKMASKCNDLATLALTYIEIGNSHENNRETSKALSTYEKAYSLAQQYQDLEIIKSSAEKLYPLLEAVGRPLEALQVLKAYQASKDSLYNKENLMALAKQQLKEGFEKERQAKELQLTEERLAQQAALKTQEAWAIAGGLGSLFLLLAVVAVYHNYRNKQKANQLLQSQNKEISEQKEKLEALDRTKSQFFANLSHELRTPLTLIASPLQSILQEEKGLSTTARERLEMMEQNSQQLKSLINDILDLSRLEAHKMELQPRPVLPAALSRRIHANFGSLAEHLGITYVCTIEESLSDQPLWLDPAKVERILNNLLSNALKHTPPGGKVSLHLQKVAGQLCFRVSDTGKGIPKEEQERIFERYYQSAQPAKAFQGGTGIGLALAKELAELMEGSIRLESSPGQGSTFTLTLPYTPCEEIPTTPDMQEEEQESLPAYLDPSHEPAEKEGTVLVVEDHPDMQEFVASLLSKRYHVHRAAHGKEALALLQHTRVDLIVSDVMMPEMDGYTLLDELKSDEQLRQIPVIMLTALGDEAHRLQALTMGVDDYLAKPFSPQELLARTHNLLLHARERKTWATEQENVQEPVTPAQEYAQGEIAGATTLAHIKTSEKEWVEALARILKAELENPDFQITSLPDQFNLSERQFQRRVKALTGLTPREYMQEIALHEARTLLENKTYHNASAVAMSVGMSNVTRFGNLYHARFGKHPREYFD